ncbi:MAG: NUDIX hydrolase [Bacteroidales bacterium]
MSLVKLRLEEFNYIYSKVPRLCVDLVISTREKIVLILRDINPGKGLWHLPGGTVLKSETLEEAVIRIATEETGLTVSPLDFKGIMEFTDPDNPFFHTVSLVFSSEMTGGVLSPDQHGKAIQTFSMLPEPMIPEQRAFLIEHFTWFCGRNH